MPTSRTVGLGLAVLGGAIAALLPVFLVLYPAAGIGQADANDPAVVLPVIARNPALFVGPATLELIGHTIGAAAMIGLWLRWGGGSFIVTAATFAGLVWMSVDAIDNAIALQLVPELATRYAGGQADAGPAFASVSSLTGALRLAGHFAGGLWAIGASVFAVRTGSVNRLIAWAGVVTGLILSGNVYAPVLLNVSFMTLPLWLVVFGAAVARSAQTASAPERERAVELVPG
jgi:hypothetical protein